MKSSYVLFFILSLLKMLISFKLSLLSSLNKDNETYKLDDNSTMDNVKYFANKGNIFSFIITKSKHINYKEFSTMLYFISKSNKINRILFDNASLFIPEYIISYFFPSYNNKDHKMNLYITIKNQKDADAFYDKLCVLLLKDYLNTVESVSVNVRNSLSFNYSKDDFAKCLYSEKFKTDFVSNFKDFKGNQKKVRRNNSLQRIDNQIDLSKVKN